MMPNVWLVAGTWVALALVASAISVRLGLSVALVEILIGILAGNLLHLGPSDWTDFLAGLGAILLTFLAGAEIEPAALRRHLTASLAIGSMAFVLPFLGAFGFTFLIAHWSVRAAEIAGIALSTTSVAVVYAVMLETGLNQTDLGKLILAACFVNDLGTVAALGVLFAGVGPWLVGAVLLGAVVLWRLSEAMEWVTRRWGAHVSEPEIKFILLVLLLLGGLATAVGSEAVLPAYLVGLVLAEVFARERLLAHRLQAIAFSLLTPFYFITAGVHVSLRSVWTGLLLITALLLIKLSTKLVGVWPLTPLFGLSVREGQYTTLLMSTGLTFGTIAALYGLTNQIIDQSQYTVLVAVIILSAVVPTGIAQTWFLPPRPVLGEVEEELEAAAAEDGPLAYVPELPVSGDRTGTAVRSDQRSI
jgi:Kef-type K+ transport system membrane component KefB